ncbi:MAG: energy coupling factor transporter S component ThiW [Aigarchaeota archaeon]|nr:energy coupling factor transporter S component ThiW [Aigarchaeota archaeon]MCX8192657.1 energy coupling factor transporter S component ThiW [Nitrososphaeria archaeon]MDW7985617.1 energy coupling factor transporter S component ThiW [Nitrososphaerota archaeon]
MHTRKIALLAVFTALGVSLAPFFWFQFLTTKAYPTQHFVNVLSGVTIGPWWAALTAIFIGTIRNMLGIGTLYAFPGGIPGGILVGLGYIFTRKSRNRFVKYSAAFLEPIGTVLIGGTFALLIFAPLIGDVRLLELTQKEGILNLLPIFWAGWAASSVPGSIIGYVTILTLDRLGVIATLSVSMEKKYKAAKAIYQTIHIHR